MPEPLHVQAGPPGPARHREDVAGRVVRRQLRPRHRAGEHDVPLDALGHREPCAAGPGPGRRRRPAARRPATRRRTAGSARISTSWPLRGTSRETQITVGRSPSRCRRRTVGAVTPGREDVGVDPRRQPFQPRAPGPTPVRAGCGCTRPGRSARRRSSRSGAAPAGPPGSAAQPTSCPWRGRDHPLDRRPAAGRAPAAPSGAAAPNHTAVHPSARAICRARRSTAGCRHQQPGPVPHHRERLRRVEGRRPAVRSTRRPPPSRPAAGTPGVHERLDAAGPRREVVGDDQRPPAHPNSARTPRCHSATNRADPHADRPPQLAVHRGRRVVRRCRRPGRSAAAPPGRPGPRSAGRRSTPPRTRPPAEVSRRGSRPRSATGRATARTGPGARSSSPTSRGGSSVPR